MECTDTLRYMQIRFKLEFDEFVNNNLRIPL